MRKSLTAITCTVLIIAFALLVGVAIDRTNQRRADECNRLVVVMVDEGTSTADMTRALRDAHCRVRAYIPLPASR